MKTSLLFHLSSNRMSKINKINNDSRCKQGFMEMGPLIYCCWECRKVQSTSISVWVPQEAVYRFPSRISYSTFGILTKYSMSHYGDTYSPMSAAVLFMVARSWTQPGCSFTEWMDNENVVHLQNGISFQLLRKIKL